MTLSRLTLGALSRTMVAIRGPLQTGGARRTHVFVSSSNGVPQYVVSDDVRQMKLYHASANGPLAAGKLQPKRIGGAVSASKQPNELQADGGSGGPQASEGLKAVTLFAGMFQNAKLHAFYMNSPARAAFEEAKRSGLSNEYWKVARAGMQFSSQNATTLAENVVTVFQPTDKLHASDTHHVELVPEPDTVMEAVRGTMVLDAAKLPAAGGGIRSRSDVPNARINAAIARA